MESEKVEQSVPIISIQKDDFINVVILGGLVGFLVWSLGALLDRFVFDAYFCQSAMNSHCVSAKDYSAVFASLIAAVAGLAGMVRLRVYRPLLVLIASFLSLWGVAQLGWTFAWVAGLIVMVVLYALAFGLFSWVARIREFWVTLLVVVVLVVITRIAFTL